MDALQQHQISIYKVLLLIVLSNFFYSTQVSTLSFLLFFDHIL